MNRKAKLNEIIKDHRDKIRKNSVSQNVRFQFQIQFDPYYATQTSIIGIGGIKTPTSPTANLQLQPESNELC